MLYIVTFSMSKPSSFLQYIKKFRSYYFKYRTVPTFETTKSIIGVQSKSAVHRFFQQLIEYGYLTKKDGWYYPHERLTSFPLFESVQAGDPTDIVADHTDTEQLNIEQYMIDDPQHTVLIKVRGESMIDAGLHEWDTVVVDTSKQAREWDMVIAIVDHEYTVKRLHSSWDPTSPRELHPANKNFSVIRPRGRLEVFWVVVGSMRRY